MRILKLRGKTENAVMKQIEKEYKENAIVLSSQKEEATGLFKWFKSPRIVVTIAVKEESDRMVEEKKKEPIVMTSSQKVIDNSKEQVSYEVLMDIKEQMSKLYDEIGELKRMPSVQEGMGSNRTQQDENANETKLIQCIKNKLIALAIKEEVCDLIFDKITEEDSEAIIRKVYDALEELLIERKNEALPQIIFFIGSTGVGKTTTLAKLTAKYVLEEHKKVVLFTSDTYRIAAVEQLRTYADILGVEIEIIYDEDELPNYIEKWKHMDHILIDTAGRSHKNEEQVAELKGLMQQIENKQVFLVLNASTAGKDVRKIVATYEQAEKEFDLILTKLDETDESGNVVNISYYSKKPIAYLTNGQNVPADIQVFNKQMYITELLGRLNDE